MTTAARHLEIGSLLFEGLDQIDLTGPFEVLARLPNSTYRIYGATAGPVRDTHGLRLTPDAALADAPPLDVLHVPGGHGQDALMDDRELLDWIRRQAEGAELVLSVCTGALLCGAAGLLRGRRATTHWASMHLLPSYGAVAVDRRVVTDGRFVFAAGVTSGIDGALEAAARLRGERAAMEIQLLLEYAPRPPFDSGTPATAPPDVLASARAAVSRHTARRERTARRDAVRLGISTPPQAPPHDEPPHDEPPHDDPPTANRPTRDNDLSDPPRRSTVMSFPTTYPTSVSVPFPSDEQSRAVFESALGVAYDPDMTLNVVRMFTGTEGMFPGVVGLVQKIFGPDGIDDPKARQMIILRVAKALDAPYEWQVNAVLAGNVGLTEQEIAAAASDGPVSGVDPDHVLVCRAVDELTGTRALSDRTRTALLDRHGPVLTRKYILSIAFFTMIGLWLNGCRVPLETTDKVGTNTSPLG